MLDKLNICVQRYQTNFLLVLSPDQIFHTLVENWGLDIFRVTGASLQL